MLLIDTAHIVCCSVCVSVWCLSVPFASCSSVQRLCCCGPHRQAILINCCRACLQHTRPAFSPYPQQHGSQHSAANASSVVFAATSGGEQRLVVHQIGRCVRWYMDTPEVFSTEMVVQTGILLTWWLSACALRTKAVCLK